MAVVAHPRQKNHLLHYRSLWLCLTRSAHFLVHFFSLPLPLIQWRRYCGRRHVSVCVSVCHAHRCPPSRDCRCLALVSAAKVMHCIQCSLVNFVTDSTLKVKGCV